MDVLFIKAVRTQALFTFFFLNFCLAWLNCPPPIWLGLKNLCKRKKYFTLNNERIFLLEEFCVTFGHFMQKYLWYTTKDSKANGTFKPQLEDDFSSGGTTETPWIPLSMKIRLEIFSTTKAWIIGSRACTQCPLWCVQYYA